MHLHTAAKLNLGELAITSMSILLTDESVGKYVERATTNSKENNKNAFEMRLK